MQAYDPALWAKLQQVILGYQASQAVYVAAKLGIADLLYDGARTVSDLAETCGAHPTALYRTLRLLASEGIFTETDVGHFTLTPMAALLRTGVPGSLRARAIFSGEERYCAWGELIYSVKTGRPAFEHVFGMPFYEYLARHPETEKTFSATMSAETTQQLQPVVAAYDFSGFKT